MKKHEPFEPMDELLRQAMVTDPPPAVKLKARENIERFCRSQAPATSEPAGGQALAGSVLAPFRWWAATAGGLAALAAMLLLGLLLSPRGGNTLYAQVVQDMRQARTWTCQLTFEEDVQGQRVQVIRTMAYKEPGYMKGTPVSGGERIETIWNWVEGRGLQVRHDAKTYTELNANLMPPRSRWNHPIDQIHALKSLPSQADQALGEKSVQGRTAQGYRVTKDGETFQVWIDSNSKDLLEIRAPDVTFSNIRFNEPLDDAMFNLTPPAGYEKQLNVLEKVRDKVEKALEAGPGGGGELRHVKEAITLWHGGAKEQAVALLLVDPQPDRPAVQTLESLTVRESDLPALAPDHLSQLQEQFIPASRAAKELAQEIRARIRQAEQAGEANQAPLWKERHQALGRELMNPDYVAILNLVGVAIYKFSF